MIHKALSLLAFPFAAALAAPLALAQSAPTAAASAPAYKDKTPKLSRAHLDALTPPAPNATAPAR